MPEVTETQNAPKWAAARVFLHIVPGFGFMSPPLLLPPGAEVIRQRPKTMYAYDTEDELACVGMRRGSC